MNCILFLRAWHLVFINSILYHIKLTWNSSFPGLIKISVNNFPQFLEDIFSTSFSRSSNLQPPHYLFKISGKEFICKFFNCKTLWILEDANKSPFGSAKTFTVSHKLSTVFFSHEIGGFLLILVSWLLFSPSGQEISETLPLLSDWKRVLCQGGSFQLQKLSLSHWILPLSLFGQFGLISPFRGQHFHLSQRDSLLQFVA
eukprot:Sdes_comp11776_c0_seq1m2846